MQVRRPAAKEAKATPRLVTITTAQRSGDQARLLASARSMIAAWADQYYHETRRHAAAQALTAAIVRAYVANLERREDASILWTPPSPIAHRLDAAAQSLACTAALAVADLQPARAAFEIGALYTSALDPTYRTRNGVYYTPPALSDHLLNMAERSGVDWCTARIVDPACGGGAFLAPVAARIIDAMPECLPNFLSHSIANRLRGYELDPFAAWLSQAFIEITVRRVTRLAGEKLPPLITVCDSLEEPLSCEPFDLVIGNPPFGKARLSERQRRAYKRSLYGHANLYGMFLDLAVRWSKPGGLIAYITPTSFLAGEYFKALRALLASEAPPSAIHLVADRKGVFADVLQETALSVFSRGRRTRLVQASHLQPLDIDTLKVAKLGAARLPALSEQPWLLPRSAADANLAKHLACKKTRLGDWGYTVSTGPLVWNRHKPQLSHKRTRNTLPLIWAESITADGHFVYRADKRNHAPLFDIRTGDDWLITREPCVLLQRTTAKEQKRRLIAAELPAAFLKKHRAAVVENHLNMVRARNGAPKVSPGALAAVLNSDIVDRAFRCISGSVAVSAFELEALPLPTARQMKAIERLVASGAQKQVVENALRKLYGEAT